MKKVFIASDHAGFNMKSALITHLLKNADVQVIDLGPETLISCDYPESASHVTDAIREEERNPENKHEIFGILVCGSGIGMSMAANRAHGIRAALATCEFHARASRQHNNANVLCLGERVTGIGLAQNLVDIFLSTEFEGGRHLRRVDLFN